MTLHSPSTLVQLIIYLSVMTKVTLRKTLSRWILVSLPSKGLLLSDNQISACDHKTVAKGNPVVFVFKESIYVWNG